MNDRKPLPITHMRVDALPVTALTRAHRHNDDTVLVRTITLEVERIAASELVEVTR